MEGDGAWWWVFWLVKMVLRSEGGGMLREKAECQCCRGMLGLVGDGWWCDRWGIKCLKKLVIVFFLLNFVKELYHFLIQLVQKSAHISINKQQAQVYRLEQHSITDLNV